MNKKAFRLFLVISLLVLLTGCGKNVDQTPVVPDTTPTTETTPAPTTPKAETDETIVPGSIPAPDISAEPLTGATILVTNFIHNLFMKRFPFLIDK
jgi:hypothetical protein